MIIWKQKIGEIADIILRIPPLFLVDVILNRNLISPWIPSDHCLWRLTVWVVTLMFVTIFALFLFALPKSNLFKVYSHLFCLWSLSASYWFNKKHVEYSDCSTVGINQNDSEERVKNISHWTLLASNLVIQFLLAVTYNSVCQYELLNLKHERIFTFLHSLRHLIVIQTPLWIGLDAPLVPVKDLPEICVFLLCLMEVVLLSFSLSSITTWIKAFLVFNVQVFKRHRNRIQVLLEAQWTRLHVPDVLRVFWITRMSISTVKLTSKVIDDHLEHDGSYFLTNADLEDIFIDVLTDGCDTVIALMGMTSIISYITHYIGKIMAWFIGSDSEDEPSMGTVSAILFFILALQTGLTGLAPEERSIRLFRNFCLLCTAILHFIHAMVNPQLMSLSTNRSLVCGSREFRALLTCFLLVLIPSIFLWHLWDRYAVGTWLLAVTAFSIEIILKVQISLLLYVLYVRDNSSDTHWDNFEDYVFYIKSTGSVLEFMFGVFLFFNGLWILVFESGGVIRMIMMCVHAYFNIYLQANEGYKTYMNRKTAAQKINALPLATHEQLEQRNDVCAICYSELTSARITPCNHYFHANCLRKWINIQDTCPCCHKQINIDLCGDKVPKIRFVDPREPVQLGHAHQD